ncbi:MAG: NAD(P)H:quinone oxidoreductase [Acidiferrobacteraceae bacterium]
MAEVLVLYYSRGGSVRTLADLVARGIESVPHMRARIRSVPPVAPVTRVAEPPVPEHGAPYARLDDLRECNALALGSPTRFGNMAAPIKHFLDETGPLWLAGALVDKPAAVFTSTATHHGGQEATLLSMALPLLHHGMILVGLPFSETSLQRTSSGGTPYGASHVAGAENDRPITEDEKILALALGRRLARITAALNT